MKKTALISLFAAMILAACGDDDATLPAGPAGDYQVSVTRTTYGIPHIKASDFGSLGYGYGYAFSQDNLCTLMEDLVAIRGERSKYWGGDGTYSIRPPEITPNNIDSDFFWKFMADEDAVQRFRNKSAPEVQQIVHGYVDGFNRYIFFFNDTENTATSRSYRPANTPANRPHARRHPICSRSQKTTCTGALSGWRSWPAPGP